jgi:hypothetical protein
MECDKSKLKKGDSRAIMGKHGRARDYCLDFRQESKIDHFAHQKTRIASFLTAIP